MRFAFDPPLFSAGVLYPGSPGSTFQISPGSSFHGPASPSQSSPRYGPPSPAYAAREFNKRRTPGLAPGLSGSGAVPYDNFLLSRLHQNNAASNRDGGGDNFSHMQGGSHMSSQWRAGRASSNLGVFDQNQLNNMYLSETLGPPLFTSETTTEAGDDELAGSGDWDGDFRWVVVPRTSAVLIIPAIPLEFQNFYPATAVRGNPGTLPTLWRTFYCHLVSCKFSLVFLFGPLLARHIEDFS